MKNDLISSEVIVYQNASRAMELEGDFSKQTVWASVSQIANLFDTDKSGISRYIKNIFE